MLRRTFVSWIAALLALPRVAKAEWLKRRSVPSQSMVRSLGEALLPGELGKARAELASDAFWRWMNGYRAGAELLHPYGSPKIDYAAPSPVPQWEQQLVALDRAARAKFGTGFVSARPNQRQELVREALSDSGNARLDDVAGAKHIALGLLAHFYSSSEATDLAYRAQIGRNKCRPLVHNGRKPLPIASS
jgi:hypothetical protein